jgi:type IV pilus assembly protein PilA
MPGGLAAQRHGALPTLGMRLAAVVPYEHGWVRRVWEYVLTFLEMIMKQLQQGFTLIELMIVVAIVGILAAIALPAYQDYVIRSKMSEGVAALAACKTSVAEYLSTKGSMPADTPNSGCSTTATQYVNTLVWNGTNITVTTQNTKSAPGDCTLTLIPSGVAGSEIPTWLGTHGVCDAKYVPSNFR